MDPEVLHITTLREALEEAMKPPTTAAPLSVVVDSVHLAQAAALLALLRFQEDRRRWKPRNAGRLATLVSLDSLLRAIATDLRPALVADPSQATLSLLSRYARYVKASASAVGDDFFEDVCCICDELIGHAAIASHRPLRLTAQEVLLRTNIVLDRLNSFRSRQVDIADSDGSDDDSDGGDDDSDGGDDDSDGDVLPFRDLRLRSLHHALQEVLAAPAAARRVTVDAVRVGHSCALHGVLVFQSTACSWDVRNIGRVAALVSVDGCFEAIGLGLMRLLERDPAHQEALALLHDLAKYIKGRAGTVGGEFEEYAAGMSEQLLAHATTAPLLVTTRDMVESTQRIRRELAAFRCRELSIGTDSDSDASDTDTTGSDASDTDTTTGSDASSTASASD